MKKFLCGVAFRHELGECDDIHFYDTLEELKEKSKCWTECGAVEIEFETKPEEYTSHAWVLPEDMNWGKIGPNDFVSPEIKPDPEAKKQSDQ